MIGYEIGQRCLSVYGECLMGVQGPCQMCFSSKDKSLGGTASLMSPASAKTSNYLRGESKELGTLSRLHRPYHSSC